MFDCAATVLVVEDFADIRVALHEVLRDDGYLVVEAENGKDALDLLVSQPDLDPCLILLDLEMPVMTGWEFLAIVKSYHRLARIPVLVVSGQRLHEEAIASGAIAGYLQKPYDIDRLRATVRSCSARSGRQTVR